MKYVAVILAGGSGKRMGVDRPKQFLMLAGKPVIQHSMERFADSGVIDEIIVVSHPDYKNDVPVDKLKLSMPGHVIPGGSSRNVSTWQAINFAKNQYRNQETALIFHDAARPNPDIEVIYNITKMLMTHSAVATVNPVTDTLYRVNENNDFAGIADRSKLLKAHTPQAFRLRTISQAYDARQMNGNPEFTDDISVVNHYMPEVKIGMVTDNPLNLKISIPGDLKLMEAIMTHE
jgi:2-C-methyl-D-erythritol 4-phosphate cytidylyltransferase